MPTNPERPAARPPVHAVTTARPSAEQDRQGRMRSYLIAMLVRTASFPLAVWAWTSGQHVLALVLVALATVIPSFAVMVANSVDHRTHRPQAPASPVQGLGPAAAQPSGPQGPATHTESPDASRPDVPADPLVGTVVASRHTPHRPTSKDPGHP